MSAHDLTVRTFLADFFIEGLTVFIVQIYFVRCIWRTVEHKWYQLPLAAIVGLICLGAFVFGIVTIYNMNRTLDMTIALQESTASGCAHVLMAGVADIYIAISLVVILRRQRTGFHRTNHLVTGLMLYTIHRGIIVAVLRNYLNFHSSSGLYMQTHLNCIG